jgi:hypothetical protein
MVPGRLLRYKIHPVEDPDPVPVSNKEEVSQNRGTGVSGFFRLDPYLYTLSTITKQNLAKSLTVLKAKINQGRQKELLQSRTV